MLVTRYRRIKGSPSEATARPARRALRRRAGRRRARRARHRLRRAAHRPGARGDLRERVQGHRPGGSSGLHPDVVTVFEMGGETSKFLRLDTDGTTGRTGIADYQTNGDCAAGTGSFMDQQASRLLYEIEDVGDIVIGGRPGGQHRRALQRVRQVRHDPRPAEGLPAARGAQGAVRRRHPQLQGHDHQGQDRRAAGRLHRRRGRQQGRGAGRARRLRAHRRAALRARPLRLDGRRRRRADRGRRRGRRPEALRRPARAGVSRSTPRACRRPCFPTAEPLSTERVAAAARPGAALRVSGRRRGHRHLPRHRRRLGVDQPGGARPGRRGRQGDLHEDRRRARSKWSTPASRRSATRSATASACSASARPAPGASSSASSAARTR